MPPSLPRKESSFFRDGGDFGVGDLGEEGDFWGEVAMTAGPALGDEGDGSEAPMPWEAAPGSERKRNYFKHLRQLLLRSPAPALPPARPPSRSLGARRGGPAPLTRPPPAPASAQRPLPPEDPWRPAAARAQRCPPGTSFYQPFGEGHSRLSKLSSHHLADGLVTTSGCSVRRTHVCDLTGETMS